MAKVSKTDVTIRGNCCTTSAEHGQLADTSLQVCCPGGRKDMEDLNGLIQVNSVAYAQPATIGQDGGLIPTIIPHMRGTHDVSQTVEEILDKLSLASASKDTGSPSSEAPDPEHAAKDCRQCHDSGSSESGQASCTHVSKADTNTSSLSVTTVRYAGYSSEEQLPAIMALITKDLSEPYSIYTYRYFIHNWPKLCFVAYEGLKCIGAIVCKLEYHKRHVSRGYIAMLAVDVAHRRQNIGSSLVQKAIHAMILDSCDEVVLETEVTNQAALRLYEKLGFVRDKRLFRYYLNGVDALRLKLWLR